MSVAVLYQSPTKQIVRQRGNKWITLTMRDGRFELDVGVSINMRQLRSLLANGESWQEFREHRLGEKLDLASNQNGIEVFYVDKSTSRDNRRISNCSGLDRTGWYWWACFPGCLPDGDPNGPFDTERGALLDVYEQVVEDEP